MLWNLDNVAGMVPAAAGPCLLSVSVTALLSGKPAEQQENEMEHVRLHSEDPLSLSGRAFRAWHSQ